MKIVFWHDRCTAVQFWCTWLNTQLAQTPLPVHIGLQFILAVSHPHHQGPFIFGSLITALASYLDAKANNGTWLVRIEDLDPPRESPEAAAEILRQLETLGLFWDGEILYQSSRLDDYQSILDQFNKVDLCYDCDCTRPQIKAMGSIYDGSCRSRTRLPADKFARRIKTTNKLIEIEDLVQGHYAQNFRTRHRRFRTA